MSLLLAVTAERSPLVENMLLRLITINLTNGGGGGQFMFDKQTD